MEQFVKTLTIIADLVGYTLTDEVIALYLHHMQGRDMHRASLALQDMSRSLKPGKGFPSVDDILAAMGDKSASDEDQARDAAALIIAAVRRFGSIRDTARVEEHVGPLGWEIIKRQGGWHMICDQLTNSNISTMQAQWRDLGKSLLALNRSGELRHAELPAPGGEIGEEIKKLTAKFSQNG